MTKECTVVHLNPSFKFFAGKFAKKIKNQTIIEEFELMTSFVKMQLKKLVAKTFFFTKVYLETIFISV